MPEETRKRGRPRKNPEAVTKPDNPDCEPASKGYVKCLLRKYGGHTHLNLRLLWCFAITSIVGMAISAIAVPVGPIYTHVDWATVGVSVALSGLLPSIFSIFGAMSTSDADHTHIESAIAKYQPPECKERKECE